MRAENNVCFNNSRIWGDEDSGSGIYLSLLVVSEAVHSKAAVLVMLIHCSLSLPLFGGGLCLVLVNSALNGNSKRTPKFGLQDQLSLNTGQKYCKMVQCRVAGFSFCLFLAVPWVGLLSMLVAFPDYTNILHRL